MTCSDNEKRLKSKSSKQKYITGAEQTIRGRIRCHEKTRRQLGDKLWSNN